MKSEQELISIIVLAYNTEQYITKCLNSILKQTYEKIEVIVINDGSTDKSSNKINRIAARDKRVKVIERENKGTYQSRLEGYKKAKGKYIMFVDSDDWILKNMVETMYNRLKEYDTDVVRCQYRKYTKDNITIPKTILNRNVLMDVEHLEPQFFDLLYRTNYCNTICKQLMKKELLKNIIEIEENLNYCEDLACNLTIYKEMKSILFIPEELYVYNTNHSYKARKSSVEEIKKKINNTIYVYYQLYLSTKEFDMKDRKTYKKIAAMRMIEKLVILFGELVKSNLNKKQVLAYISEILEDKRVIEVKKIVDTDIVMICNEIKQMNKITIKACELLLTNKLNQLYTYDRLVYNPFLKKMLKNI